MGGGSHDPDSEIDDRPSILKASVSGAKSTHSDQGHRNMDQDLDNAYLYTGSVEEHRGHGPQRNSHHSDIRLNTRFVPSGAQGGRGPGSRGMADQWHETSQWHDMSLKDSNRHQGTDLATLRRNSADLKAYLRSLSHETPQEPTREHDETVVCLIEIESDMNELEREEPSDGKPCHEMRERMDGIDFDRNRIRVGDRVHQSTHGCCGSEIPKPRNIHTEGRNPGGLGHGCQRPVAEADIASTTRDLPRLEVESREGGHMPRGMRPSFHYYDLADFAGEESEYQPRGSCLGPHLPPAGHGHSGRHVRHFVGR